MLIIAAPGTGHFDECCPEQQDVSEPEAATNQHNARDIRESGYREPAQGRGLQRPCEEFAGFEAVCQRSTEKIGDHRDEAISTLCHPELGGTELKDLEESRSKKTGHVIGQGENGLAGKNQ